jgi:hypothetical protein
MLEASIDLPVCEVFVLARASTPMWRWQTIAFACARSFHARAGADVAYGGRCTATSLRASHRPSHRGADQRRVAVIASITADVQELELGVNLNS